jgi:hypothetical protein
MIYPVTSEDRQKLIDDTLRDFVLACPVINKDDPAAIANMREELATFSSSKLMYLKLSSQFDAPPSDEEIMANVKKMRMTHDGCRGWDNDSHFQFFRRWLRRGVIESTIELRALEVVYEGVSRRDANNKPVLDAAAREFSLAVLEHTGWNKPVAPTTTVNNYIATPGEIDKQKRAKFDELAKIASENEEAAGIIEAMKRGKNAKKESPLAVGLDGELKENNG